MMPSAHAGKNGNAGESNGAARTAVIEPVDVGDGHAVGRLAQFVSEALERGGVERFELLHVIEGEGSSRVASPWTGEKGVTARAIAVAAYGRARSDSEAFTGVQRYALVWYRAGGDGAPQERLAFRVASPASGSIASSEGPNAPGVLAMSMRHIEAKEHMTLIRTGDLLDSQAATIREQQKTIADQLLTINKLVSDRVRNWDEIDGIIHARAELAEGKNAHEIELKKLEGRERLTSLFGAHVQQIFPILMAKLTSAMGSAPTAAEVRAGVAAAPAPAPVADAGGGASGGTVAAAPTEPAPPVVPDLMFSREDLATVIEFLVSLDQEAFEAVADALPKPAQQAKLYALVPILMAAVERQAKAVRDAGGDLT